MIKENQTTQKKLDDEDCANAPCSAWGRLELISKGLKLHGFELSRGTWRDGNGDTYNTFCIKRSDNPEWRGVWMGWDDAFDKEGDDGELFTVISIIHNALSSWSDYNKYF